MQRGVAGEDGDDLRIANRVNGAAPGDTSSFDIQQVNAAGSVISTTNVVIQPGTAGAGGGLVQNSIVQVHRGGVDMGDTGSIVGGQIQLDLTEHREQPPVDSPQPRIVGNLTAVRTGNPITFNLTMVDDHPGQFTYDPQSATISNTDFVFADGTGDAFTITGTNAGRATIRVTALATHSGGGTTMVTSQPFVVEITEPVTVGSYYTMFFESEPTGQQDLSGYTLVNANLPSRLSEDVPANRNYFVLASNESLNVNRSFNSGTTIPDTLTTSIPGYTAYVFPVFPGDHVVINIDTV